MSGPVELKKCLAVVTGGAGFVGSHVVDALVREGARVRIVDSLTRGEEKNLAWAKAHGQVEIVNSDIRDASLWDRLLPGADLVFHQAALRVNRCEENPEECWEVMVQATRRLLEGCVKHRIQKVIAASSAIAYGAADTLPTPETQSLNQNSTWYGTAKIANEQMLNTYFAHDGLPGIALRYFNIYGPRMATQGHTEVLVKWFQALEEGKSIRIFGDGLQTMDWVHVMDVARANILAATSGTTHGVFNIASGIETDLRRLADVVLKSWGRAGSPELMPGQAPVNPIPRRWADITAARRHLAYEPQMSLEMGMADMVRWWREPAQTV